MLESKEFPIDTWDNSLPEAFDDFKDIDFDKEKFRIPLEEFGPMYTDELLSICMLRSLGQTENMLKFKDPLMHLEKFRIRYQERLNEEDLEDIMVGIYDSDNTRNREFTRFLSDKIAIENPQDTKEVWREILSYSIIYCLQSETRNLAIKELEELDSAYDVVRKVFKS